MLALVNSAVMSDDGTYRLKTISEGEFIQTLQDAEKNGVPWRSFIGYESTAFHIQRLTGIYVPVSRDEVHLKTGDTMLVCRLRYRLSDSNLKRDKSYAPGSEDYQYHLVSYVGPEVEDE